MCLERVARLHRPRDAIACWLFGAHPEDFPPLVGFARKWSDRADERSEHLRYWIVLAPGKRALCVIDRVRNVVDDKSFQGPGTSAGGPKWEVTAYPCLCLCLCLLTDHGPPSAPQVPATT